MNRNPIPARDRLMSTVSELLDGDHPQDILVEDVLRESGVARGSLYHHFDDFPALIEATLLDRFSHGVDRDTKMMRHILEVSKSGDEFWDSIFAFHLEAQSPERAHRRAERARILGLAKSSERFRQALAVEQERMTTSLADAISRAQEKGWVRSDLCSRAIAVFIQAFTLGRAVDDVALTHVDPADWVQVVRAATGPLRS